MNNILEDKTHCYERMQESIELETREKISNHFKI
jgi:hypothetical protein